MKCLRMLPGLLHFAVCESVDCLYVNSAEQVSYLCPVPYKLLSPLLTKTPSSLLPQAVIETQHTGCTLEGEGSRKLPPSPTG